MRFDPWSIDPHMLKEMALHKQIVESFSGANSSAIKLITSFSNEMERIRTIDHSVVSALALDRKSLAAIEVFERTDQLFRQIESVDFSFITRVLDNLDWKLHHLIPDQAQLRALAESLRGRWIDLQNPSVSLESITKLAALGKSVELISEGSRNAIERLLGDWKNAVIPAAFDSDWRTRREFYLETGFDTSLTVLPEPSFSQALVRTGIVPVRIRTNRKRLGSVRNRTARGYLLFRHLEHDLRIFICDRMTESYGDNWLKSKVSPRMLEMWEAKRAEVIAKGEDEQHLICYSDFAELLEIISRKDTWRDVFQPLLPSKHHVITSFERLNALRRPLMHARPLTKEDYLLLTAEVTILRRSIGG